MRLSAPDVVPSPVTTLRRAGRIAADGELLEPCRQHRARFRAGQRRSAIGGGIAVGLWLGFSKLATEVADPMLGTLYSIPKITLYPIILLIFGLEPVGEGRFRRDPRHLSGHHLHHERVAQRARRSIGAPLMSSVCRRPPRSQPFWCRRRCPRYLARHTHRRRGHAPRHTLRRSSSRRLGAWLRADPGDGIARGRRHFRADAADLRCSRRDSSTDRFSLRTKARGHD